MNVTRSILISTILFTVWAALLTGCGSTPAKFYVLSSIDDTSANESNLNDIAIGLHNINFTGYLERNQIVTKKSANEIVVNDFHRWGEPLEENFERVLMENLSIMIPTENVHLINVGMTDMEAYFLTAEVTKFELGPSNIVTLDVWWQVSVDVESKYTTNKRSVYTKTVSKTDYATVVSSMSDLLAEFSLDVADEIKSLNNN